MVDTGVVATLAEVIVEAPMIAIPVDEVPFDAIAEVAAVAEIPDVFNVKEPVRGTDVESSTPDVGVLFKADDVFPTKPVLIDMEAVTDAAETDAESTDDALSVVEVE